MDLRHRYSYQQFRVVRECQRSEKHDRFSGLESMAASTVEVKGDEAILFYSNVYSGFIASKL